MTSPAQELSLRLYAATLKHRGTQTLQDLQTSRPVSPETDGDPTQVMAHLRQNAFPETPHRAPLSHRGQLCEPLSRHSWLLPRCRPHTQRTSLYTPSSATTTPPPATALLAPRLHTPGASLGPPLSHPAPGRSRGAPPPQEKRGGQSAAEESNKTPHFHPGGRVERTTSSPTLSQP